MGREPGTLTARDGYVLDRMLRDWPPLTDEWLALLRRKLAAGRLPPEAGIPAGLATIDARVAFRCASGLTDSRTLCLPRAYAPGSAFLPVTTFYGLALLGLREGEAIRFDRPEGRRDCVSAWNKDPAHGVIGVQTGPPSAMGLQQPPVSSEAFYLDACCGDNSEDTSAFPCAGQDDQGDLPGVGCIAESGAEGSAQR